MRARGFAAGVAVALGLMGAGSASAAESCSRYAQPGAPPGGNGLSTSPFGSVQALVDSLGPGETGCLRPGTFIETVRSGKAARADAPIRIVSENQSQPAVIQTNTASADGATLRLDPSSAHIHFANVVIRGARTAAFGSPAVVIGGTGNRLLGTEVTNAGNTTCISVGINPASRAHDTVLDGVSVHGCGREGGDNRAAGIAVSYASGTQITNSYVFGNPGRGIQLYPDAVGSRIENNVVDGQGNGVGDGMGLQFAGDATTASRDNLVTRNVFSNNEAYEVGYNWEGPVGTGNVLSDNCLFHPSNSNATIQRGPGGSTPGFTEHGNTPSVDPLFTNRAAPPAGLGFGPGTPCLGKGPVPVPTTGTAATDVDPEAKQVIGVVLTGAVDAHLQPADYAFELNGNQAGSGSLPPLALPQDVISPHVAGLRPSTRYEYRVVGRNGGHAVPTVPASFTTPAAPPITPPVLRVGVSSVPVKGGVKLKRLTVKFPPRSTFRRITCDGRRCPFGERPFSGRQLLLLRTLPPRTRIRIHAGTGQRLGRYNGSGVSLTVTPRRTLVRRDYCLRGRGRPTNCLRVQYAGARYANKLVLKKLLARRVPVGATLWARCVRGKCAKPPACRVFQRTKSANLLPPRKRRTMRPGSVLEIRIHKPDTRGVFTRISYPSSGPSRQTYGFLSSGTRPPRSCRDA